MAKTTPSPRALLAATAVAVGLGSPTAGQANSNVYLFGVVPQQSATRLAQMWIPFLRRLSYETGLDIRFATTKDIPTFESCLARGAYEFAYMNPYHYTVFHDLVGYDAFARQAGKKLQGLVVVHKGSGIKTLKDLNGRKVAFPSPAAFGASILPRAEMRSQGISFTPQYVNSHDSVYRAVASDLDAAGAGVTRTFNAIPAALRDELKVIYRTKAYTAHPFAAIKAVPADVVARVRKTMTDLAEHSPDLVAPLGMKDFEPATDADWNDVRALHITDADSAIVTQGDAPCRSD